MTNDLRIADAPLLVDVSGEEKLPTGGYGNYSTTINQIADFTQLKWKLATEGYVNNEISVVTNKLNNHTQDKTNPHEVTKEQVGLGKVDNTADLDKPVSAYQQSAIDEKISKASVVDNLTTSESNKVLSAKQGKILQDTKANKSEVYTKDETLKLKREDQYVITESGKNLREFNDIAFKNVIYPEMFGSVDSKGYADTMFNNMVSHLNANPNNFYEVVFNQQYKLKEEHNIYRGKLKFDMCKGGLYTPDKISLGTKRHQAMLNFYGGGKDEQAKTTATTNISLSQKVITVANASTFRVGDYISITSSGEYWNGITGASGYGVYFKGELTRIESVSSNQITLQVGSRDSYDAVNHTVIVQRINFIEDILFLGGNHLGRGNGISDYSDSLSFAYLECSNDVRVIGGNYKNFPNTAFLANVGMRHKMTLVNFDGRMLEDTTNIPQGYFSFTGYSPYGITDFQATDCTAQNCRRLVNADQSIYRWVNDSNGAESIHSRDIIINGGVSTNCYAAISGHQYKGLTTIGHRAVGCHTGIQARGKDLTCVGFVAENCVDGIVLGVGSNTDITAYSEDPTCGNIFIDETTQISASSNGIHATQSWDSLICNAEIKAPRAFIAYGKRQSNAKIKPNWYGDGSIHKALEFRGRNLTRNNISICNGLIQGYIDGILIHRTESESIRNLSIDNIDFLDVSGVLVQLGDVTTGSWQSGEVKNCKSNIVPNIYVNRYSTGSVNNVKVHSNSWQRTQAVTLTSSVIDFISDNENQKINIANTNNIDSITEIKGIGQGCQVTLTRVSNNTLLPITITNSGAFKLKNGNATLSTVGDSITFIRLFSTNNDMYEVSRSIAT